MTDPQDKNPASGFFAVDKAGFINALHDGDRMDINQATAYLVLACGTGRDHSRTSWSTQAVEKYTGISRPRAKAAIDRLVGRGAVRQINGGTRPVYAVLPDKKAKDCDFIWLPNAAVTGAADEKPPIELIRQTQDPLMLRLFVELYDAQNLRSDGGIHWRIIRQNWKKLQVSEYGQYVVWGFCRDNSTVWPTQEVIRPHFRGNPQGNKKEKDEHENSAKKFWSRWDSLVRLGLVQQVPHLVEADTPEAEIIHPLPRDNGETVEMELTDVGLTH